MKIVLIGNVANGIGLQRDAEILSAYLSSRGHVVAMQQYDQPASATGFDLAIFLETMSEHLVPIASRHWIIINPEWFKPDFMRPVQRHCEKVLAKTRDAERILRAHFSSVHYIGFTCADRRDTTIPRVPECLHVGGNSGHRGTAAVLSAWREYRYWDSTPLPPLTVISNSKTVTPIADIPGITFIRRATDDDVTRLQNSCLYHILPSAYEGYGHALHESQSVRAILLTTQAPPMTELCAPFEVAPSLTKKACLATLHEVSPSAIRSAISRMMALPNYDVARMQVEARARFERDNADFERRMDALLTPETITVEWPPDPLETGPKGPLASLHTPTITPRPIRIAVLGNFRPEHSTENDLAWTLTDMGHRVIKFQEDEDSTEDILTGASTCNLFLYIHTHGWVTPGRMTVDELITRLSAEAIPTASFHLDRYWGLNALDRREDRIGEHPFWRTDRVFTADGGNQQRFADRGVAHSWLAPGVVRRDCYRGVSREDLEIDVGFVGAEGYHSEYQFRGQLIEFLRAAYGSRFRIFTGYRGRDLNDLYASIRVVVGDSCFGGSDYYWSDRVPETLGRGGFLLHPTCRGLQIPGLVTFTPGDLHELQDLIDYYLAHDSEREHLRCAAHHWVCEHETYNNRMTTLLRTVGLA